MQHVRLQRIEVDVKALARKVPAHEQDFAVLIDKPTLIYEENTLRIAYLQPEENLSGMVEAFQALRYHRAYRTSGLRHQDRTVGFMPRNPLRQDYCYCSVVAMENPEAHAKICSLASLASRYFEKEVPEQYVAQAQLIWEKVQPGWVLPGSIYTSGIANWNNQLYYHRDAGNFPGFWSAMFAFTKDIDGGHLAVPQLGIGFKFIPGSLILFDGSSLLHGVTPIRSLSPRSYRYTVVFYSLRGMCHCQSPAEELDRARRLGTIRSEKRGKKP
jgi:hypothetical protein